MSNSGVRKGKKYYKEYQNRLTCLFENKNFRYIEIRVKKLFIWNFHVAC